MPYIDGPARVSQRYVARRFVEVSDIGGVIASFVSTGLLRVLGVSVAASALMAWVAVRRGWVLAPGRLNFAAMVSVCGILVFTVFREGVLLAVEVVSGAPLMLPGWQPAGFLWTMITRRSKAGVRRPAAQ